MTLFGVRLNEKKQVSAFESPPKFKVWLARQDFAATLFNFEIYFLIFMNSVYISIKLKAFRNGDCYQEAESDNFFRRYYEAITNRRACTLRL